MIRRVIPLALAALILLLVVAASNATLSVPWFTQDGGGATSTGNYFAVSGTIGQADAGVMSGGDFTLAGGFWSGVEARYETWFPIVMQ